LYIQVNLHKAINYENSKISGYTLALGATAAVSVGGHMSPVSAQAAKRAVATESMYCPQFAAAPLKGTNLRIISPRTLEQFASTPQTVQEFNGLGSANYFNPVAKKGQSYLLDCKTWQTGSNVQTRKLDPIKKEGKIYPGPVGFSAICRKFNPASYAPGSQKAINAAEWSNTGAYKDWPPLYAKKMLNLLKSCNFPQPPSD
jgi:hypothetical protein